MGSKDLPILADMDGVTIHQKSLTSSQGVCIICTSLGNTSPWFRLGVRGTKVALCRNSFNATSGDTKLNAYVPRNTF